MSRRMLTALLGIIFLAIAISLFVVFAYTPTIMLHIHNDTGHTITVTSCGSDPATIYPGATATVDPNPNNPNASCVVYEGESTRMIGCLSIPTTKFKNGSTVEASGMRRSVLVSNCGN